MTIKAILKFITTRPAYYKALFKDARLVDITASILGFVGAIFLAKGILLMTPDLMAKLSQSQWDFNMTQVENIAAQKTDFFCGILLILFAFVMELAPKVIEVKKHYAGNWPRLLLTVIALCTLIVALAFSISKCIGKNYERQAKAILLAQDKKEIIDKGVAVHNVTMTWSEFTWNILANLVAAAILSLIPISISLIMRRKFHRFLGLEKNKKILRVYVSTLYIDSFKAADATGTLRSYRGKAVPEYEFNAIQTITNIFNLLSKDAANIYSKLVNILFFRGFDLHLSTSPMDQKEIIFDNTLSIGGPGYNEVTKYYFIKKAPFFIFDQNNTAVVVNRGNDKGKVISGADDFGILQKVFDKDHGINVFIAAGIGVNGTRGALEYLMNNWKMLDKKYRKSEFGICLRFPNINQNPFGYLYPQVERESQ